MTTDNRILLAGATASPYTRKMVALLRYRHLPYRILWGEPSVTEAMGLPAPKVRLHPTFFLPDAAGSLEAIVDSTPIIRRLESDFPGRSVIPANPVLAFLNYLLEDFGDEWCTKYMFHYRWAYEADIERAGTLLPLLADPGLDQATHAAAKEAFSARQVGRLGVVGSNEVTRPVIEGSYVRFLRLMDDHLQNHGFLLGERPASADFAVFGQLTQLVGFDPTPMSLADEYGPRTVAWTSRVEDLSGLEPGDADWCDPQEIPDSLLALLGEVGRVYVPALLANAAALQAGEAHWETEIDGRPWRQQTFPYQGKCLAWINEEFQALDAVSREAVLSILAGTGCELLIQR
jgi:glutathione S-transferase